MLLQAGRFILRDLQEANRAAFRAYQMDARYRRLYDFGEADEQRVLNHFASPGCGPLSGSLPRLAVGPRT